MANTNWSNAGHFYAPQVKPVLLNGNFIVDSTNGNGLGIRSLKGPGIASVRMQSVITPVGSPAMGTARTFGLLGASAVTNTGSSVITGNIGVFPGSAITGFPPGAFSGQEHITDVAASNAQASAQAAYTDLHSRASTVIATALDAQSLTAGVYSSAGGTFTLAQSAGGTLTLTGSATDIFVFQTATTLTTGAGGIPVITLAGGALASNVYWVVGSSATINSGSAGTFQGNIIAQVSITDTLGGTVNGSLVALTGAVTLSAASVVNVQLPSGSSGSPGSGLIVVQLAQNFNRYLGGFSGFVSPLLSTNIVLSAGSLVIGNAYVIVSLGTTTTALNWISAGLRPGYVAQIGSPFIALTSGAGLGNAVVRASGASGIDSLEVIGDPNTEIAGQVVAGPVGAQLILQALTSGIRTAPVDGSVVGMSFYLSDSAVTVAGQ